MQVDCTNQAQLLYNIGINQIESSDYQFNDPLTGQWKTLELKYNYNGAQTS
jgi:hypothetical protein